MQRAARRKVKEIRDRLRELYSNQPDLFTEEQTRKAFGFQEDNKTYICQSAKELTALFGSITGGDANG